MESGPAERTFVTVDAAEAGITRAGEVAPLLADAAPPRAAHVGGDLPHPGRVVGRHGNSAAVDGCETRRSDFIGWEDGPGPLEAWGWGGAHLGRGRCGSSLRVARTSSHRSLRDRRSRSRAPCCDTWPRSGRGGPDRAPTSWKPAQIKEESLASQPRTQPGSRPMGPMGPMGTPKAPNEASWRLRSSFAAPGEMQSSQPSGQRDTDGGYHDIFYRLSPGRSEKGCVYSVWVGPFRHVRS